MTNELRTNESPAALRDRLLVALERAASAETKLAALQIEYDKLASESRGSVPVGYVIHRAMGEPYFQPYDAVYGLPFGEHDLYAAPAPPAVASGEPTAEHWKQALRDCVGPGERSIAYVERRANELLARSAAAKGEG